MACIFFPFFLKGGLKTFQKEMLVPIKQSFIFRDQMIDPPWQQSPNNFTLYDSLIYVYIQHEG